MRTSSSSSRMVSGVSGEDTALVDEEPSESIDCGDSALASTKVNRGL